MASLFKTAKRGPKKVLLTGVGPWPGVKYPEGVEWKDRVAPPMCHTIMLSGNDPRTNEREEYLLEVSEDEMIRITSEWLTNLHNSRARAARLAFEKEAREKSNA